MKKFVSFMVFVALAVTSAMAYQFSAVAPTGQTLYFIILSPNVYECGVYPPGNSNWEGYETPTGELVIPDSVQYQGHSYAVSHIGAAAFYGCDGLTSVTIPSTVTRINNSAFYRCRSMEQISVPSTVTVIEDEAFGYCINLTELVIPSSVDSIGYSAFNLVRNLIYSGIAEGSPWDALTVNGYREGSFYYSDATMTTLTGCIGSAESAAVPEGVSAIGDFAFIECASLASVTLPSTLSDLGNSVFGNCTSLTSIAIPSSVSILKNGVFKGCSSLAMVDMGSSITEIGNLAFGDCVGLAKVTIPASVTKIGNFCFRGCTGLTEITSKAQVPPTVGTMAFDNVDRTIPVYIPSGTLSAYQTSWGYFDHFVETSAISDVASFNGSIEASQGGIVVKNAVGECVRVYDITGRLCHQERIDSELWRCRVSGRGCYLVQVGATPAQKVVVFE